MFVAICTQEKIGSKKHISFLKYKLFSIVRSIVFMSTYCIWGPWGIMLDRNILIFIVFQHRYKSVIIGRDVIVTYKVVFISELFLLHLELWMEQVSNNCGSFVQIAFSSKLWAFLKCIHCEIYFIKYFIYFFWAFTYTGKCFIILIASYNFKRKRHSFSFICKSIFNTKVFWNFISLHAKSFSYFAHANIVNLKVLVMELRVFTLSKVLSIVYTFIIMNIPNFTNEMDIFI